MKSPTGYRGREVTVLPRGRAYLDLIEEVPLILETTHRPQTEILRTPGDDRALAAGMALTRGWISSASDILGMDQPDPNGMVLSVSPEPTPPLPNRPLPPNGHGNHPMDPTRVRHALDRLCRLQTRRRCSHAAALFSRKGSLLSMGEDVGRHNAVDKARGQALLDGTLDRAGLMALTCRMGRELVHKAARADIPLLASLSGPTSLAVDTAQELGISLASLNQNKELLVFCNDFQLIPITQKENHHGQ